MIGQSITSVVDDWSAPNICPDLDESRLDALLIQSYTQLFRLVAVASFFVNRSQRSISDFVCKPAFIEGESLDTIGKNSTNLELPLSLFVQ